MNVGDLIQMHPKDASGRETGVVLVMGTHHPDSTSVMIPIIKVFWNTGSVGWIAAERMLPADHRKE